MVIPIICEGNPAASALRMKWFGIALKLISILINDITANFHLLEKGNEFRGEFIYVVLALNLIPYLDRLCSSAAMPPQNRLSIMIETSPLVAGATPGPSPPVLVANSPGLGLNLLH
ncbi:predicted protein [Histoplasma capsulatum G186AR]|uniref:Uncharacterized protein n=1 Tax=Ajellomyces capsulatus (strain G186AR / H82 / ATCC MYA-2454 / RMSCC 2432) TaxID=447093 RepID=C0NBQ2_AJECG|nr:uncharacterized protein HCBG_00548 [Histoplasma capsulatum G186AR]EEH11093.1 predicted protein [Histoplasma capsulatum G186AR]